MEDIQMRWIIRRDMDEVLQIEDESFDHPWSEEEFICCLRQKNVVGLVAESGCKTRQYKLAGFILFELHRKDLRIANFAVGKQFRRKGVGMKIMQRMKDKLSIQQRTRLTLNVRETNLPAQLFFQSCGFVATGVIHNAYNDCDEDSYSMEYRIEAGQLQTA